MYAYFLILICIYARILAIKNQLKRGFKSFLLNLWQDEIIWNCGTQIFCAHIRAVQNFSKRFFEIHLLYCFDERGSVHAPVCHESLSVLHSYFGYANY